MKISPQRHREHEVKRELVCAFPKIERCINSQSVVQELDPGIFRKLNTTLVCLNFVSFVSLW